MTRKTFLALAAVLGLGAPASAQVIDCACSGDFAVGDRVITLVDNPGFSAGLPAGTLGTVICGDSDPILGIPILVRWDNFTGGVTGQPSFCDCLVPAGNGTTGDTFVRCTEIVRAPVRNVTQGTTLTTLQAALDVANNGDVIEIDPGVHFEDDIEAPHGLSVTIRGAGRDKTILDGMGASSPSRAILLFFNSSGGVTISDLTFRNGMNTIPADPGAVVYFGTPMRFENVDFVDSTGDRGHIEIFRSPTEFIRCTFRGAVADEGIFINNDSPTRFQECLFDEPDLPIGLFSDSPVEMLSTTFIGTIADSDIIATLTNTVFDRALPAFTGGSLNASRSLFPGATGDNVDGLPTFVDAVVGDYRLAPGSLGIDAGDVDAYLAAGGGIEDLNGAFRFADDTGTPNTGTGISNSLDLGAFEFQGTTPGSGACPGDANGDGSTTTADITFVVSNLGCTPN